MTRRERVIGLIRDAIIAMPYDAKTYERANALRFYALRSHYRLQAALA